MPPCNMRIVLSLFLFTASCPVSGQIIKINTVLSKDYIDAKGQSVELDSAKCKGNEVSISHSIDGVTLKDVYADSTKVKINLSNSNGFVELEDSVDNDVHIFCLSDTISELSAIKNSARLLKIQLWRCVISSGGIIFLKNHGARTSLSASDCLF